MGFYKVSDFFPQLSKEEVLKRVGEKWHLDGRLPLPKFKPKCPICESEESLLKGCRKFDRSKTKKDTKHGLRCDVSFKCTSCSHVWVHGVSIPEEMYNSTEQRFFEWRDALKIYQADYSWLDEYICMVDEEEEKEDHVFEEFEEDDSFMN